MGRFSGFRGLTIGTMLLALLGAAGCAPPDGLQRDDATTPTEEHKVPFHNSDGKPSRPVDSSTPHNGGVTPENDLPFHDPQNLPAGTLLTVRMKNAITAENPDANGVFEALIDQPVVIEGNQLVPLGAIVSGRVESARASNLKRNWGYVRLTLESIQLAGLNVPVQTSSLFVRGNARPAQGPQSPGIRLEKGRRLIFRLSEPAYVATGLPAPPER